MFYETENGEEIPYMLSHPSGILGYHLNEAIEIQPDEIYWRKRINSKHRIAPYLRILKDGPNGFCEAMVKYWVHQKDYDTIRNLVRLLEIDETHLDDLIYIIINYNTFEEITKDSENLLKPNEAQIVGEFLREFKLAGQVTEISVKIARRDKSVHHKRFLKPRRFLIKNIPLINDLIQTIQSWRVDSELFGLNGSSPKVPKPEDFKKITLGKELTELKESYLLVFYDFLFEKKLANSHQDTCRKLGVLWSFHPDTVPSYEDWLTEYSEDEGRSHYENHIADLMRMKISRALKKRGRTKRA